MDIRKEQWIQPRGAARVSQTGWQRGAGEQVTIHEEKRGGDMGCLSIIGSLSIGAAVGWILFPVESLEFARRVLDFVIGLF